MNTNDGGPAFPQKEPLTSAERGMSLRDYAAIHCQADDRLVKAVRAMDDNTLAIFALSPDLEREDWITELENASNYLGLEEVEKVVKRLSLEAKAIARVRYMQADAMLRAREEWP